MNWLLAEAVPPADVWTQFGIAGMLVAGLVYLGALYINKKAASSPPTGREDQLRQINEQLIRVIQESTEANSNLVKAVETQTRVIDSLAIAINQLIGRLERLLSREG